MPERSDLHKSTIVNSESSIKKGAEMKGNIKSIMRLGVVWLICFGLFSLQPAWAVEGNIDTTYKYAWSENSGWENFRSTHGGVTVHDTHLSGCAWAENIGWVKLGSGTGPYVNDAADNWGVNHNSSTGALSGYAWSEHVGWINFSSTPHSKVTINPGTGEFDGYAWGENVGWVHFKSPDGLYGVATSYRGRSATPVPTLNQWSMTALVLLLGILAVRMMKRRREDTIRTI